MSPDTLPLMLWPSKAWFHLWNYPLQGTQTVCNAVLRWSVNVNANNALRAVGSKVRVK